MVRSPSDRHRRARSTRYSPPASRCRVPCAAALIGHARVLAHGCSHACARARACRHAPHCWMTLRSRSAASAAAAAAATSTAGVAAMLIRRTGRRTRVGPFCRTLCRTVCHVAPHFSLLFRAKGRKEKKKVRAFFARGVVAALFLSSRSLLVLSPFSPSSDAREAGGSLPLPASVGRTFLVPFAPRATASLSAFFLLCLLFRLAGLCRFFSSSLRACFSH